MRRAAVAPSRSGWARFVVVLVAGLCAGCQRGCLSTWLRDHGLGGEPPPSSPGSFPVVALDCVEGLAQCSGGVVEVSRAATRPARCNDPREQGECGCPWDTVGTCPHGCAADDRVIEGIPREKAMAQLCAPAPGAPPPSAAGGLAPPGSCGEEAGFRCVGGVVVACTWGADGGLAASAVATCPRGCVDEASAILDDDVPPASAVAVLCAR